MGSLENFGKKSFCETVIPVKKREGPSTSGSGPSKRWERRDQRKTPPVVRCEKGRKKKSFPSEAAGREEKKPTSLAFDA